ncbi:hypothetical protein [Pseudomonas aeruginosa]|uniref:Putative regulator PrlF n=1 Tax=Pseudomonas fluorescens TaxID=294 RepID=A0A3S4MW13_PSEFL|nr:hypothetical protein [Pseudomonas aeruginosa]VEE50055.1 putative regulator PrlF [Pseudomonas fluorescens]HBN9860911.1 hypothetical protein [Pseudomonas aeruginosa]HBN9886128.1 hypothetical protein [Pseudomonas aeruginosa]
MKEIRTKGKTAEKFIKSVAEDLGVPAHAIQPVTTDLLHRIDELVGDEAVDLEAPLSQGDE